MAVPPEQNAVSEPVLHDEDCYLNFNSSRTSFRNNTPFESRREEAKAAAPLFGPGTLVSYPIHT